MIVFSHIGMQLAFTQRVVPLRDVTGLGDNVRTAEKRQFSNFRSLFFDDTVFVDFRFLCLRFKPIDFSIILVSHFKHTCHR